MIFEEAALSLTFVRVVFSTDALVAGIVAA